ncbi:MAG: hypothetical protein ACK52I_37730, partial [Pseudomonadota bacterium]
MSSQGGNPKVVPLTRPAAGASAGSNGHAGNAGSAPGPGVGGPPTPPGPPQPHTGRPATRNRARARPG